MAVCQNLVPLVNIKIAGKWMFILLKMVLIGIDPYPYRHQNGPSMKASFIANKVPAGHFGIHVERPNIAALRCRNRPSKHIRTGGFSAKKNGGGGNFAIRLGDLPRKIGI